MEQAFAASGIIVCCIDDARDALCRARQATPPNGRLVVTGSMYLVGEIRSLLREARA
jgi:folylpolyglutamate synthase/dihydropteroate synthase